LRPALISDITSALPIAIASALVVLPTCLPPV
jgi:hypothetical protein